MALLLSHREIRDRYEFSLAAYAAAPEGADENSHLSLISGTLCPMRILILHNRYIWPGGEDAGVADEAALLRAHGHEVVEHTADNRPLVEAGALGLLRALWQAAWSRSAYQAVRARIRETQPDIVHVHNWWFAFSPSVFAAAHDEGRPTVATLHNFRVLCPGAVLLNRAGQACDACVGRSPWPGVWQRCYHDSFIASGLVARMIQFNRKRRTWWQDVDRFLVPSEFCKRTLVRGGLPAEKIRVKPSFAGKLGTDTIFPAGTQQVEAPAGVSHTANAAQIEGGKLVSVPIFVGRLSREKGLHTLLAAWKTVQGQTDAELQLVGDGPLRAELEAAAAGARVRFLGQLEPDQVQQALTRAAFLILPSECFETFGRVVIEAYACSRPAIVSRIGGPAELVQDGETGFLFEPGNAEDLAAKLTPLLTDPALCQRLGANARQVYEAKYTPERNVQMLEATYAEVRD